MGQQSREIRPESPFGPFLKLSRDVLLLLARGCQGVAYFVTVIYGVTRVTWCVITALGHNTVRPVYCGAEISGFGNSDEILCAEAGISLRTRNRIYHLATSATTARWSDM